MGFDTEHLKYFISVAQLLNFSEAARQNSVPQPKISRSIVELERELGTKLFSRNNRDVTLTREGETFLPYAVDIVDMTQKARDLVAYVHSGRTGYLSIATLSTMSRTVAACLYVFSQKYPEILIDITQTTGKMQAMAMLENRYDFNFGHRTMLPPDGRLDYLVTHRDKLVVVVPKGHRLTQGPLDYDALFKEKFIMISQPESPQLYSQIMSIFARHHAVPNIIHRYDKAESVLLSVGSGLGVSIIPLGLTKAMLTEAVDVIPLEGEGLELEIEYVCAWPRELRNPSSKLFLEVARDYFAGDPI